jgi:hypothetical protein
VSINPAKKTVLALALVAVGLGAASPSAQALDQGPILRVLRTSDVPQAKSEYLPSGALTLSQFASNDNRTSSGARAEQRILAEAGFRSSAISGFVQPNGVTLTSTAVELGSASAARRALEREGALSAREKAPPGTVGSVSPDGAVAGGIVLIFRSSGPGGEQAVEVIATAGSYLYALDGVGKGSNVSRRTIEHLLRSVIARG